MNYDKLNELKKTINQNSLRFTALYIVGGFLIIIPLLLSVYILALLGVGLVFLGSRIQKNVKANNILFEEYYLNEEVLPYLKANFENSNYDQEGQIYFDYYQTYKILKLPNYYGSKNLVTLRYNNIDLNIADVNFSSYDDTIKRPIFNSVVKGKVITAMLPQPINYDLALFNRKFVLSSAYKEINFSEFILSKQGLFSTNIKDVNASLDARFLEVINEIIEVTREVEFVITNHTFTILFNDGQNSFDLPQGMKYDENITNKFVNDIELFSKLYSYIVGNEND
ncbi:hypothetical protein CI105_05600 [Candidatus Izimaplasma bacterium ZiA1]|uniref:hypothetical protein n=1 Tax=Candidatus Izimoplasma sp. ZiA1 TaxID=2024899 RepID=UPI000BAA4E4D|nr:hypothetical protein CI105_05600 [Candidatus Izimaplasma bacterium ZiA1]